MIRLAVRAVAFLTLPALAIATAAFPADASTSLVRHSTHAVPSVPVRARPGFTLNNAPVPASCGHTATKLNGTVKDFGYDGFTQLDTAYARYGHLKGHKGRVAVVPMTCSAGGVTWPQYVLVYQKSGTGPALIGSVPLGSKSADQEHEDVTGLRFAGGKVTVNWHGYDGAGFIFSTYRGTLGWHKKHATWKHTGPLVIDYETNQSGQTYGVSVTGPDEAGYMLVPAPKSFTTFIQQEYDKLVDTARGCDGGASVQVARYSHKGFAVGGEGACGGAAYLWARVGGTWKSIMGWQDYPTCGSLTKLQRRGYTATGQPCWNPKTQQTVTLGHWPKSGI